MTQSSMALKKESLGTCAWAIFIFSFIRGKQPLKKKKETGNTLSTGADDTLPVAT